MVTKIGIAAAVVLAALIAAPSASLAAKKGADWRNTPIPNQSAQFYRSSHKSSKHKSQTTK
jgi:hypothetical protein